MAGWLTCFGAPFPTEARAQGVEAAAPFTVEVALVRASREGTGVDGALAGFQRELAALPYTQFVRVAGSSWSSRPGGHGEATLGDVHVAVDVSSATAEGFTAAIVVTRGGSVVARTSFSRPWGRSHVVSLGAQGTGTMLLPVRISR